MRVLGIDPSSTRTGYAILTGLEPEGLVEAGYLAPRRTRDAPLNRIDAMAEDLAQLIAECRPQAIIVEITSGKVNKRHGGGGAGLGVHGMATGMLLQTSRLHTQNLPQPAEVITVAENDWTDGKPKAWRNGLLATLYPAYASRLGQDRGGDIGDAIGLARWWMRLGSFPREGP